jgi:pilus assembly protein CpaF
MSLLRRIEKNQDLPAGPLPEHDSRPTRLEDLRIRRAPVAPVRDTFQDLKSRIHSKLIAELDPKMDVSKTDEVRQTIEEMYDVLLAQENLILGRADRQRLLEQIVAEILGYGPIEPLLSDDSLTEVMVNGPNAVFVERSGRIEATDIKFESDDHVLRIIDRIVSPLGRRIDESQPYVDARLPDGSRVNAVIPPLSLPASPSQLKPWWSWVRSRPRPWNSSKPASRPS